MEQWTNVAADETARKRQICGFTQGNMEIFCTLFVSNSAGHSDQANTSAVQTPCKGEAITQQNKGPACVINKLCSVRNYFISNPHLNN